MNVPTEPSAQQALANCRATRLAHFTPARNLPHILSDGAIRSSKDLADNAPDHFDPTDLQRFDQHPDKVCCTFQMPNGYYLDKARKKNEYTNYPDWVCLFLDVDLVLRPRTLFAPANAATRSGQLLREGGGALEACFAPISGEYRRGPRHMPGAATNLQAEVLVPGPIDLRHLQAVAVPSASAAATESARLRMLGADPASVNWVVSPVLFDRDRLSASVRFGTLVPETPWTPPHAEESG
jgi:hypothetical protein